MMIFRDVDRIASEAQGSNRWRVLVTCQTIGESIPSARALGAQYGLAIDCLHSNSSEQSLISKISKYHGWIIGDEPATAGVFVAGAKGLLRGAVRFGPIANVDLDAARCTGVTVVTSGNSYHDGHTVHEPGVLAIQLIDRLIRSWKPLHID